MTTSTESPARNGSLVEILGGPEKTRKGVIEWMKVESNRPTVYGVCLVRSFKQLRCDRSAFKVIKF